MNADKLLKRLEKVRQTGRNKWQACCPAHQDNTPSLMIKEEDDGRILIHCFAGCSAADVLHLLEIRFADLYPVKPSTTYPAKHIRKPWSASDVLTALAYEVLIVLQCARRLTTGQSLPDADYTRLLTAVIRLQRGHEVACNG